MDNRYKVGSPDSDRINISEDYELQYWSEKFGISTEELKAAVKAAGTYKHDVEAWLKKK